MFTQSTQARTKVTFKTFWQKKFLRQKIFLIKWQKKFLEIRIFRVSFAIFLFRLALLRYIYTGV
jgi:hypothetical protein